MNVSSLSRSYTEPSTAGPGSNFSASCDEVRRVLVFAKALLAAFDRVLYHRFSRRSFRRTLLLPLLRFL